MHTSLYEDSSPIYARLCVELSDAKICVAVVKCELRTKCEHLLECGK